MTVIKTKRSNILIELEEKMSLGYRKLYENSVMDVLIEEKQLIDCKEYYTGYTKNYIRILVPAEQLDTDDNEVVNNIYNVKCTGLDALGKHMYAELC
jgi:2-methylthioadenine synthetase